MLPISHSVGYRLLLCSKIPVHNKRGRGRRKKGEDGSEDDLKNRQPVGVRVKELDTKRYRGEETSAILACSGLASQHDFFQFLGQHAANQGEENKALGAHSVDDGIDSTNKTCLPVPSHERCSTLALRARSCCTRKGRRGGPVGSHSEALSECLIARMHLRPFGSVPCQTTKSTQ